MRRILSLLMLLMLSGVLAFAQNRVVTGTVTDEKGAPIEGASVKVKGSRVGVAADVNGNFRISAPENATLVISSAGASEKQVPTAGQSNISVSLTRTGTELANVIVTAQGIRRQPKELGYSTTRLSNADVNAAHVTNVANGLTGKVSGLQINTTNNGVNPSTRITLRGNRSILGNNQALLVLDNVPVSLNYLNSINPNDIDNVTVLKGSSASALYGSDATNGVLIVTTKTGTKGKPVIRYSNTTQVEEISYTPNFQNKFGQFGGEYDPSQFPGIVYFPEDPFRPYVPYENQNYGPEFNGKPVFIGAPVRFYRADGTYFDSLKTGIYSAQPNAKKNFFDKGITSQNDFSVSGGDEKSKFFFSVQDVDTKGTVPGDRRHRDALRLNGSREIGRFTINYDAGYTISKTDYTPDAFGLAGANGTFGGSYFQNRNVYFTVINTPANIDLRDYRNWKTDPFANPNGYFNAYYGNPWWQIDQTREIDRQNDLLANVSLTYKPATWLSLLGRASVARQDFNSKYTRVGLKFSDYAISDVYGSGNIPSSVKVLDPQAVDALSFSNRLTGDFIASADKTFGNVKVRLVLGSQVVERTTRRLSAGAVALVQPNDFNISNKSGEIAAAERFNQRRTIGAYADLTLGYNDYLFLHGSARNDWTSLLSQVNRSFFYPSADLSFVFTDAIPGLKGNKTLSFGKVRAAYSRTGQVSIDEYQLENTFSAPNNFPYGGVAGFTLDNIFSNPNIKPEFTTEKEVGLELGFLENRINLSAAYYHTSTSNQTIPIAISAATGGTSSIINTGVMTNDGVEFDLKLTPLLKTKSGLRWDFNVNFSYINNKVISIAPSLDTVNIQINGRNTNSYAITGQAYPTIKVLDWVRDSIGRLIVDPSTGYPKLGTFPKIYGTANPPYKLGLNTTFSYKGLTLSATADYRAGGVIYNAIGNDLDFTGVSAYSTQSNRQRFVLPNSVYKDPTSGKLIPNTSITTNSGNEGFWASTWNAGESNYINSSDFWKLREVSLNYELPRSILGNLKFVKGVNIGVTGRNLVMWRAKENVWTDPEFANTTGNATGTTNINQTPPTRIFGGNITINF